MDQRDAAASGAPCAELSDEALAWLELAIEAADGCFPCDAGGPCPETDTRAELVSVMPSGARGE
ncbi:MAG TPA: hypothetical protein VFY89_10155 [Ktedonobacterales bacterium]